LRRAGAEAEVSIPFRTKLDAQALSRALGPEIASSKTSRASVRVTRHGTVVTMRVLAKDLVALRALLNSFLRLGAAWRRVSEEMRGLH